jgi:hypothetical protein
MLVVAQLVAIRRFIIMFTADCHWTLSWTRWLQLHMLISLRSSLVLASHLRLDLSSRPLHSVFFLTLYLGGPGFKSPPGDRQYWLRFLVLFLSPSRRMPGEVLILSHDCFLPHPFQFIIHVLYRHFIQRYVVLVIEKASLSKLHIYIYICLCYICVCYVGRFASLTTCILQTISSPLLNHVLIYWLASRSSALPVSLVTSNAPSPTAIHKAA